MTGNAFEIWKMSRLWTTLPKSAARLYLGHTGHGILHTSTPIDLRCWLFSILTADFNKQFWGSEVTGLITHSLTSATFIYWSSEAKPRGSWIICSASITRAATRARQEGFPTSLARMSAWGSSWTMCIKVCGLTLLSWPFHDLDPGETFHSRKVGRSLPKWEYSRTPLSRTFKGIEK